MKLSSVGLSVHLSVDMSVPSAVRHCGGFAAEGPEARRHRSTAARPALSSKRERCHVCQLTYEAGRGLVFYLHIGYISV